MRVAILARKSTDKQATSIERQTADAILFIEKQALVGRAKKFQHGQMVLSENIASMNQKIPCEHCNFSLSCGPLTPQVVARK